MKIADLGVSQEFDGVDAFLTSTAGNQNINIDEMLILDLTLVD